MKQFFLVLIGSLALLTGSLTAKSWTDLFKDFFYGPTVVAKADIFERDVPTEAQLASRPSDTHLVGKAANMIWEPTIMEVGKRANVTVTFTPQIGRNFKGVSWYFVLHKNDVNNGRPVYYELIFGAENNSCLIIKKGGRELTRVTHDQQPLVMLRSGQQQSWVVAVNMSNLIVYNVDQEVTEVARFTDQLPVKFVGYAQQNGVEVTRIQVVTEDKEPVAITAPVAGVFAQPARVEVAPVVVEEAPVDVQQVDDSETILDATPEEASADEEVPADAAQEEQAALVDDSGDEDESTDEGSDQ